MIVAVATVSDFDLAIIGEGNTMSSKSGSKHTVEHIYTMFDRVTEIVRYTNPHEISWLVMW
jgi:hypothetical protein